MTDTDVLTLKQVPIYAGIRQLLEATSLRIPTGCIAALIGNNGSGKTSLLRTVAGYIPRRAGTIHICEQPIEKLRGTDRVHYLCYVPQRLEYLPLLSVEEFLAAAIGTLPGNSSAHIDRACSLCSLDPLRDRLLTVLSAGELRQALIATCFLSDAPLVLLDEPTSNLDPANQHHVLKLIQMMQRAGRTVLFTTHSFAVDLQIADTVFSIYDQQVHLESETGLPLTAATLERIYKIEFSVASYAYPCIDGSS